MALSYQRRGADAPPCMSAALDAGLKRFAGLDRARRNLL
jgi:hypothetical protein